MESTLSAMPPLGAEREAAIVSRFANGTTAHASREMTADGDELPFGPDASVAGTGVTVTAKVSFRTAVRVPEGGKFLWLKFPSGQSPETRTTPRRTVRRFVDVGVEMEAAVLEQRVNLTVRTVVFTHQGNLGRHFERWRQKKWSPSRTNRTARDEVRQNPDGFPLVATESLWIFRACKCEVLFLLQTIPFLRVSCVIFSYRPHFSKRRLYINLLAVFW